MVLLMTPGLAFFYGGMVRMKSVLNMMMMSFIAIGIVSILWVLYGYSLDLRRRRQRIHRRPVDGRASANWSANWPPTAASIPIPALAFAAFQLMFAVITVALISGAIADRAKFLAWSIFAAIWVTVVYFPVAHWVFDFGNAEGGTAPGGSPAAASSTSPVVRRSTSTPVLLASRSPSCSVVASVGPRRR